MTNEDYREECSAGKPKGIVFPVQPGNSRFILGNKLRWKLKLLARKNFSNRHLDQFIGVWSIAPCRVFDKITLHKVNKLSRRHRRSSSPPVLLPSWIHHQQQTYTVLVSICTFTTLLVGIIHIQ